LGVDIFELSVAIGMFAAFLGLAVEMAAIFQFLQQFGNGRGAHLVTHRPKRPRQLVVALGDPSQRPHRIAHRRGLEQSLQVLQKRRVPRRQPRAPPALATHLPGQRAGVPQVLQTASNRASGDLRRTRGGRDPAVAGRLRLGGGTQPSASLVKRGTKRFKSDTEGRFIYHYHDIDAALEDRNPPIPNPIHLFLAVALSGAPWSATIRRNSSIGSTSGGGTAESTTCRRSVTVRQRRSHRSARSTGRNPYASFVARFSASRTPYGKSRIFLYITFIGPSAVCSKTIFWLSISALAIVASICTVVAAARGIPF